MRLLEFAKRYQWVLMGIGILLTAGLGFSLHYSRDFVQDRAKKEAVKSLKDILADSFAMIDKVEMSANTMVPFIEEKLDKPDSMFVLNTQLLQENPLLKGCSISFEPFFFKEKGRYFSAYAYNTGTEIATEQEGTDDYQYFCMDWYLIPRQLDRRYWIEPYAETSTDGIIVKEVMTSFSQPLHDPNGKVIGVLSVDMPLKWLSDSILSHHPFEESYCMLIGRGGTYIVHPDSTRLLYESILTPTLEGGNPELMRLGRDMIGGKTGSQTLMIDSVKSHVFYTPFARTGWSLALVCPDSVLMRNYYILSCLVIILMVISVIMIFTPVWSRFRRKQTVPTAILLLTLCLSACQRGASDAGSATTVASDGTVTTKFEQTSKMLKEILEKEPDRMINVIDSLEQSGAIGSAFANYERGDYYYAVEKLRTSVLYFQKSVANDELLKLDKRSYYDAFLALTIAEGSLYDVEGCLSAATRGYQNASKDTSLIARNFANKFLDKIGQCQLKLGREEEAAKTYAKAGGESEALALANPNNAVVQESNLAITNNIVVAYMNELDFKSATVWVNQMERALQLAAGSDISMDSYAFYAASVLYNRSILYAKTGHPEEAEITFRDFLATDYAKTTNGLYDKAYFYGETEQWDKLRAAQLQVDSLETKMSISPTLDYVIESVVPTFEVLKQTGYKDKALEKASQIFALLDTVKTNEQKNASAELAVIYETQQKEEQIAAQEASIVRQRYVTAAIISGLVTIALLIFFLLRHFAAKRLEVAHEKLLVAYDQLEETTTAKERYESELRIARDIQMSMVPSTFPERENLDMFASMTPAREVGGDLYDYLLQDNELYFCVGDVSGKGVPASLFMAQTIRLFRALAKQHLQPSEIATMLNAELSENNENGMFVTMFIGLMNLDTGHLAFCNAGHNPPVLGGDAQGGSFLEVEPNATIGLWPGIAFEGEEIETIKGRPLFIYTDGLNEAENRRQEQLGDDRLLKILRDTRFASSRQVIETLTEAVNKHRQGAEPNDDLTMMCLNVK